MKKWTLQFFLLVFALILASSELYAGQPDWDAIEPHPRLLLCKGGETEILEGIRKNSSLETIHKRILAQSQKWLTEPPVKHVMEGKRLLAVSREALKRIFYLSYAYRTTKVEDYARRAEQEMLAVCDFTDWNPSHFLDVGEMTMAVAIGYDWLFNQLASDSREQIRRAILEKGFKPSEDKKQAWFYRSNTNWNSVCNSGLLFGALAIYEDEPELSKLIIERCLESNPLALATYAPSGVYPEGYGYWAYGTSFQVMLIAALESALGNDFSLSEAPGFLQSAYFMQMMCAPDGSSFNFSDTGHKLVANPAMLWFASKLNDLSVLWVEKELMANKRPSFGEDRLLPTAMIYGAGLNFNAIKPPKRQTWSARQTMPLYFYRSGWTSPKDTYLAVKGGTASVSHAHMDAGSFVFVDDGARWAMDLGMQGYYSLESKGVDLWSLGQDSERWDVFRLSAPAHNTITINGEKHSVKGVASLVETFESRSKKGATFDLTPIFGGQVRQAVRTVTVDSKLCLEVEDVIENDDTEALIQWVMCTPAQAEIIDGNRIALTMGDKRRILEVVPSYGEVEMKIWTNNPPHDYDAPNPGSCRVGFEISIAEGASITLHARLLK